MQMKGEKKMEMINLMQLVNTTPWVMDNIPLQTLMKVFDGKLNGDMLVAFDNRTKSDWKVSSFESKSGRQIDYMFLSGTMTPRTGGMTPECGMVPMIAAADVLWSSDADDVILHMDSGGGMVVGVPEFANTIKAMKARGQRVIGYTDTVAASGGYWGLAHCDEIIAAPSARLGSVGVYVALTKRVSTEYKTTIIKAGDKKAFGSPDLAVTEEEIAYFKGSVAETYKDFTESVAEGRGVAVQEIVDTQAEVFAAKRTNLLVDEIMTFAQLMNEAKNS
jgi:ClpP class serine protease